MNLISRFGLPLLTKELVEQAAQRRTYVIRVVYALLLFIAGFAFYRQIMGRFTATPLAVLGRGQELYASIVLMQFMGIYLFMPAMTSGVITSEKERNSLGLLFLTRLGPWAIVLEKFFGRVIPMLSFLLLSVPLLVIAYALGGITQQMLWSGIWFLCITVLQIGALGLFCSTFYRTNVAALIATYLIGIAMFLFVPTIAAILHVDLGAMALEALGDGFGTTVGTRTRFQWLQMPFFAPAIFGFTSFAPVSEVALASLPILMVTAVLLILARVFLIRRAFVPPGNVILKAFGRLDKIFTALNDNRITRGVVLLKDRTSLATLTEPVAWRETTKTALGSFRYLIRLLLLMEIPVIVISLFLITNQGNNGPLAMLILLLWVVITLVISVKATSLVAGERSHQTLDVLLTTPMSSFEILQQKIRGVRRLMVVLSIPLLTAVFFKTWLLCTIGTTRWSRNEPQIWSIYVACALLAVVVYLPMVSWVSMAVGVRVKNQGRAVFAALAMIVAWCAIPVFLALMMHSYGGRAKPYYILIGPATIIVFNESFTLARAFGSAWAAIFVNFLFHGAVLWAVRAFCLKHLDRSLGRATRSYQ